MPDHYPFQLGTFSLIALEDKNEVIDIRNEMKQVQEGELLEAMKQCDYPDFNVKIGFNCLYLNDGENNILIDCGTGQDELIESLSEAGLEAAQIDFLIITHSDFDHIGGIDDFPNAKIILPGLAWDLWTEDLSRGIMIENFKKVFLKFLPADFVERGAAYRENYGATKLPALSDRIILVEPEKEFLPGIQMIFTPGHRPDHFGVKIESEGETLIHIADGFRHAVQVLNPHWYTRFDSYPAQMAVSLERILKLATDSDATIFGSHFTFPGLAKLSNGRLHLLDYK